MTPPQRKICSCKTRYVTLPDETIAMLRRYRLWQLERRLQAGPEWVETGLLFTRADGRAMHPGSVNHELREFTQRHGLPHIHPHQFRHTVASVLIANGTDVLTVSNLLGHADPTTTLETYAHAIDEARRKAADCVSTVILQKKKA